MKKITIVSDFYVPHWTGISKSIAYLAEAIKEDFVTSILTVRFDKNLALEEEKAGLKIIRRPYFFSLSRAKFSLSLIFYFLKNINKTDLVLINSPSIHILPISLIAKLFRKKILIFHQGDLVLPKGILNFLIEFLFNLSSLMSFYLATQLATYTEDYAFNSRLLKKFPKKTMAFIPPLPYFSEASEQKKSDIKIKNKLLKIKKDKKFLIGFAGRFTEEKGFDVLLKAGLELSKKRKDFVLIFAGQTNIAYEKTFSKNKTLVDALKNQLIFLGLLNDSQLKAFYQSLDLFVLPSRSECFALVQAEAMAQKTPVLVSNIVGARDAVKQTNFGLLFESEDADDLAKKIERCLAKLQIFDNRSAKISEYFDYKKSKESLLNFLNTVD
jgi:glycosyltransferase involved in cell wall biosynthesis